MPKELKLQKDFVDAVNEQGGFAFKLSHRFLVGVPDLMVKWTSFPAALFECKQDKLPVKQPFINVKMTPLQHRFLRRAYDAGMDKCGVISFAQRDKQFAIRIIPIKEFIEPTLEAHLSMYAEGPLSERRDMMTGELNRYMWRT